MGAYCALNFFQQYTTSECLTAEHCWGHNTSIPDQGKTNPSAKERFAAIVVSVQHWLVGWFNVSIMRLSGISSDRLGSVVSPEGNTTKSPWVFNVISQLVS